MKKPTGKPKRARKRKPSPVDQGDQFNLDQELRLKHALEEDPEEVIKKIPDPEQFFDNLLRGEGGSYINVLRDLDQGKDTSSSPPTPPSPQILDPYEQELKWAVEKRLKEYGVTNILYLLRKYSAHVLVEALEDYQRAVDEGFRIRYPTAYFRSLLK